jgi:hypothetical protein
VGSHYGRHTRCETQADSPNRLAPAKPGDYFDAHFDADEDAIVFRRLGGRENWLAVMKECPVSPDDVPPRRRELPKRRKL